MKKLPPEPLAEWRVHFFRDLKDVLSGFFRLLRLKEIFLKQSENVESYIDDVNTYSFTIHLYS